MLLKLEKTTAEVVRQAITEKILTLPEQLRRSVTWDQGKKMASHVRSTLDTGVQVYFCDLRSPWQRGSNENTNGLLRQYFPKGTNLSVHTKAKRDAVAKQLNGRPRQTLDWITPLERFTQAVASTT
jgi:IS30 family transposase